MADTFKNTNSLNSNRLNEMTDKVSKVTQDVVGTIRENRALMYTGIGVFIIGAGFGVWALIRRFGGMGTGVDMDVDNMNIEKDTSTYYKGRDY